ncbi:zinc ABC transporter substrate-binding protein ZnuA [Gilliamella sp. CG25]|uniref:zinc ABC transporter substrate-binding protein ZnuA n=1 Tax=unclassified Gilliamella TaxID=2685620 RepID=UPI003987102F
MKNHIVKTFKLFIQYLIILTPILIIQSASNYANATVISSVKPIGFITQAITSGITDAEILLPDGASPHTYSLKPSDLKNIKSAELVIWVGEDMETFMPTLLKNIDKQKQIELMEIPAIKSLLRTNHDDHSHEEINHHQSDHDHHGEYDEHIWLSPEIAKIIAQFIHDKLITLYPDKKIKIDENLNEFTIKLSETEQNIAKKLINVQNRGYFVFHDAYGYFESQFRLKNLGSFTINPAVQPGAQKVYAIQQKLKEHQAVCVFIEPQFSPAVIEKLVNGTNVRIGELNPLGTDIMPSKDAYFQFLMKLTQQLLDCLDK